MKLSNNPPKTAAERMRSKRQRLKKQGLTEFRVIIPDTQKARDEIKSIADQLVNQTVKKAGS